LKLKIHEGLDGTTESVNISKKMSSHLRSTTNFEICLALNKYAIFSLKKHTKLMKIYIIFKIHFVLNPSF